MCAAPAKSDRSSVYSQVNARLFEKFDVLPGFWSRCQSWKYQVSPGLKTVLCGKLVRSGEKLTLPRPPEFSTNALKRICG